MGAPAVARPRGRPRVAVRRTIRVEVFFTPDEWAEAELIAASHSWYQLAVFMRELLLREIAKPEGARVLGEDAATRAAIEANNLRMKRELRLKKNTARLARAARLSGQSEASISTTSTATTTTSTT